MRRIEEVFQPGNPGFWHHPEWAAQFPWLLQGTTGRARADLERPWDFALFTDPPAPGAREAWESLGKQTGFPRIVHSQQIHGREVLVHGRDGSAPGGDAVVHEDGPLIPPPQGGARLRITQNADGHITDSGGILLGVTIADCVPAFLVDPGQKAIGLLHAGWRGAVAGILERGIEYLGGEYGSLPEDLHLHLGPAICGDCYEVGREVHLAMGLPEPAAPSPVDLRGHLSTRAITAGMEEEKITESVWCSLCGGSPFFSHRRGEGGRQVGFLGIMV